MIVVFLIVGVLFLLLFIRRGRKQRMLAGLIAERPTFTVEPPARRLTSRKRESL